MRRLTALFVAGSLVLIAACGDDDDEAADTTPETEAPAETDPPETDPPPETDAPPETDPPPETDAPAETDPPPDTEAPAETDPPPDTEAPVETDPPATDPPTETDPPPDTGLVEIPDWDADNLARVVTKLLAQAQGTPIVVDPVPAYDGGTPDLAAAGLGVAGFASTIFPTEGVAFDTTWPETWTVRSDFDTAYSQNIPAQTISVVIFDGDPTACPGACGVSFFGTQPGVPVIGTGPHPAWLFDSSIFTEFTAAPGGQTDVVFGLGNGAGFDRFADPSWLATVDSAAGHAAVIVAPFEVTGSAVFDAPDFTTTAATAEVVEAAPSQPPELEFAELDETWLDWAATSF